ncbi:MAG TPA: Gfo/Idh/MocA family oxidoreductase [Bryobacteraceae bacterium]|nr:Gfo/Idh/MocA family oxidoreductase [Bryobacteraceae bacterium]
MNLPPLFPLDYIPKLPINAQYGIGMIGAGQIVNQAHLPAYRKAGFRVLAIADVNPAAAAETAKRFDIPRVCATVEELLGIPEVEIADIAVPARENPRLCAQALAAGKHALVQKPMAETLEDARQMTAQAHTAKRKLAVNHQMRWAPSVRAASDLLTRHLLGEVVEFNITIQIRTAWSAWPWLQSHPYPELAYHSIHYLDTLNGWFGEPRSLYATLAHYPGSNCAGPTRAYVVFEYPNNLRGSVLVNHHTVVPADDLTARFTIEGVDGQCQGLIGLLLNYPTGRSDTLRFSHRDLTPAGSIVQELSGRWFPDAFIGPMSSLMDAITQDSEPETSGDSVLRTMRMMEAVRTSHETKQAVTFS